MTNDEEIAKKIDKAIFPGIQGGPLEHVIAAKAVCFKEALSPEFKEYQKKVVANAKALSDALIKRGFDIVSGGTDNHIVLLDLRSKNVTGKDAEKLLDEAHITVNKNSIPFDPANFLITSGVRLGTPAVTTRGMNEEDMETIAEIIEVVLGQKDIEKAKQMSRALTDKYPLYKDAVL